MAYTTQYVRGPIDRGKGSQRYPLLRSSGLGEHFKAVGDRLGRPPIPFGIISSAHHRHDSCTTSTAFPGTNGDIFGNMSNHISGLRLRPPGLDLQRSALVARFGIMSSHLTINRDVSPGASSMSHRSVQSNVLLFDIGSTIAQGIPLSILCRTAYTCLPPFNSGLLQRLETAKQIWKRAADGSRILLPDVHGPYLIFLAIAGIHQLAILSPSTISEVTLTVTPPIEPQKPPPPPSESFPDAPPNNSS